MNQFDALLGFLAYGLAIFAMSLIWMKIENNKVHRVGPQNPPSKS